MRRAPLALALSLALTSSAFAQLPSPLDLVRGLRSAGLVDLAILRLGELTAKPGLLTPDEVKLVALEMARIRLEQAARESEDGKRAALLAQARGEFDTFIRDNAGHPMVAQANVDLARLLALQAKTQAGRANRVEGAEAKAAEAAKARPLFTDAIARYQGAIAALEAGLKLPGVRATDAAELTRSRIQAELDAAVLQFDLGLTFSAEGERPQRGDALTKAEKAFTRIGDRYGEQRVGLLAHVWTLQCQFSNGDEVKALKGFADFEVAYRANREASDAFRQARFFGIEHIVANDQSKDSAAQRLTKAEQAADRWLKMYPEARGTPEGLGARYRRATLKEARAKLPGGVKVDEKTKRVTSVSAESRLLLTDANAIYKELTETDNEYTDRAQRRRLTNQLILLEAAGKGGDPPPETIRTLEQGYLAAQVQQARLLEVAELAKAKGGMTPEQLATEEKKRLKQAADYLERGLKATTPKDQPREVFDARMLLMRLLTQTDRPGEAADQAEELARKNPKNPKAASAARQAVFACNAVLAKAKEVGDKEAEAAGVARIKSLAEFAEATWPTEPATDAVRHIYAFYLHNRDKDYAAAWAAYSRISAGYPDVAQARREMAGSLFYLVRPDEKDARKYREQLKKNITEKAVFWQITLRQLDALPEPAPAAPVHAVEAYAGAKIQLAQLYMMAGDYPKTEAIVKAITAALTRFTGLDAKKRDDLTYTARALRYNALQGEAADAIKEKDFAKVATALAPDLAALKEELKAAPPPDAPSGFDRMRKAQRDLIIAAMTAFVQDKKVDKANELLDLLQKTGGTLEDNIAVMRQLVSAIRGQIDGLKKEGKDAEAKDLSGSFTEFLDKIRGADSAKHPPGVIAFLGQGYASVDEHAKAAELFRGVLEVPFVAPKDKLGAELKEAEEADAKYRRQMNFFLARALRQAGGPENYKESTALMKEIVGDPMSKTVKPADRPWGYGNVEIRKEYVFLLEDQRLFAPAMQNWKKMMDDFARTLPPPPKKEGDADGQTKARQRQLYFDLYYETYRCSARAYSSADPTKYKEGQVTIDKGLTNVGQKLFEVVSKNPDMSPETQDKIQKLIEQHPKVKSTVDALAAAAPKS